MPLNETLEEMLNEHHSHRTERRGCGYTQATRHLAVHINRRRRRRATGELALFREPSTGPEELVRRATTVGFDLPGGSWRNLDLVPGLLQEAASAPTELRRLIVGESAWQAGLRRLAQQAELEESRLLMDLILDLILPVSAGELGLVELSSWGQKLPIGTCPLAEKYFLEVSDRRVRRNGRVNIVVDAEGRPVLVEKIKLGDDHSSVSLVPLVLNGVRLPAGSLVGTTYDEPLTGTRENRTLPGEIIPLSSCRGFRFLRLTTMAVSPENRHRAFTKHFEAQKEAGLYGPEITEIAHLRKVAEEQL